MPRIGYCTNVHAGVGLDEMLANLDKYAVAVRDHLSPSEPLGLGLWLSSETAATLATDDEKRADLASWLDKRSLLPYTINAFPFGDFHSEQVKHAVYEPAWWNPDRAPYTIDVAQVFHDLLPNDQAGTISTLPIGWPGASVNKDHLDQAAVQFGRVAAELEKLEQRTGRHLRVCLEPEPGCILQSSTDVVRFFDRLRHLNPVQRVDRYLGVCHDTCHAAVMYESQADALQRYEHASIEIGKVQISSAIVARPDTSASDKHSNEVLQQLSAFAEDRYLHQTVVRTGTEHTFFDDLPEALEECGEHVTDEWRIHFHVPIFLEQFGALETTQSDIHECLSWLHQNRKSPALEVETYAWSVLPSELRNLPLADGIAKEIKWLRNAMD